MSDREILQRLPNDPRYLPLVRERARFAWALSILVVGLFMAFILVIAFDKALFAVPVGNMVMTWGIPIGIGLILLAILSIALFTRRANRDWDARMAAILADAGQ